MVDEAMGPEGMDPELHKRAKFWTQQYVDAASPTNFP